MKKTIALLLSLCMAGTLLSGCGSSNDNSGKAENGAQQEEQAETGKLEDALTENPTEKNTEKTDETLVVALMADPTVMYPQSPNNTMSGFAVVRVLFDRLVELNTDTGEIEPALATEWEWIDELHLKMKIRTDAVTSDGSTITANDVYYTLEHASDTGSGVCSYYNMDETSVEDAETIIIGLTNVDNGFLYQLAQAEWSIVSQSVTEANGGVDGTTQNPCNGTGKYTFTEYKPGEYLMCERNENYWNKDYTGYYKYIKFVFIPDNASRILAVQSGDADVALGLNVNQTASVEGVENVDVITTSAGMNNTIFFNCQGEYTKDIRVRQAMRYLISAEAMNQIVNLGKSVITNDLISPTHPYYYDVYAEGYAGEDRSVNVEKAKELLAEAGYPDGFEFTELCMPAGEAVMTAIQAMLAEGGITMNIELVDTAVSIQNKREGDYNVCPVTTFGECQGITLFQYMLPSQQGISAGNTWYSSEEYDALLETATTSLDEEAVKQAYEDIQKMIYDECLMVGTYVQIQDAVVTKGLTGLRTQLRTMLYDVSEVRPAE